MLKLRVKALCKEKGIKQPFTALKKAGISVTKVIQYLADKTDRLMLDDIEKLCLLLHCTPNDLVEWTPDNTMLTQPNHPLQALQAKPVFNLEEKLKTMSAEEIRRRL